MSTNYITQIKGTDDVTYDINEGVDTRIFRAKCTTGASTAAKVATLDDSTNYTLAAGVRVAVTFQYGNSATTPTLNVNNGGAKTIVTPTSATNVNSGNGTTYNTWGQYETVIFTYNGTYWVKGSTGLSTYNAYNLANSYKGTVTKVTAGAGLSGGDITSTGTIAHSNSVTAQTTQALYPVKIDAQGHISAYGDAVTNATAASGGTTVSLVTTGDKYTWNHKPSSNVELGQGYGECTDSSSTTACTVTLANYLLVAGGIVVVKFLSGVQANSTLNINSKGAKEIRYQGSRISSGIIQGGDIVTFIYTGAYYYVLAIDRVVNSAITPADYVIATASNLNSGVNGYTMWASGKLEIWIRQTMGGVNINSPYGSMYYGSISAISYQLTPSSPIFIEYPIVNITVQGPAGVGIAVPNYDNYSTTDTGTIYLYNPASVTNKSITVNIYAVGRWKE